LGWKRSREIHRKKGGETKANRIRSQSKGRCKKIKRSFTKQNGKEGTWGERKKKGEEPKKTPRKEKEAGDRQLRVRTK